MYGAATAATATTRLSRYLAGEHFPSDHHTWAQAVGILRSAGAKASQEQADPESEDQPDPLCRPRFGSRHLFQAVADF